MLLPKSSKDTGKWFVFPLTKDRPMFSLQKNCIIRQWSFRFQNSSSVTTSSILCTWCEYLVTPINHVLCNGAGYFLNTNCKLLNIVLTHPFAFNNGIFL